MTSRQARPRAGTGTGSHDEDQVDYGRWGEEFFAEAVSEPRVLGAVNTIAGQPIDFGPIGAGPGRIAKVRAHGTIGEARATRRPVRESRGLISYRVELPVEISFEVDLQVETQRFDARLLVPLTLTAVAPHGRADLDRGHASAGREVQVDLRADGLRASVLQRVVGMEDELRRFVAKYVARELDKPHVQKARLIDVSHAIDAAWATIGPRRERDDATPAGSATADLDEELEREIRDHESAFAGEGENGRPDSWLIPRHGAGSVVRFVGRNRMNRPRLDLPSSMGVQA